MYVPAAREIHGAIDEDTAGEEDVPTGGQLPTTVHTVATPQLEILYIVDIISCSSCISHTWGAVLD